MLHSECYTKEALNAYVGDIRFLCSGPVGENNGVSSLLTLDVHVLSHNLLDITTS